MSVFRTKEVDESLIWELGSEHIKRNNEIIWGRSDLTLRTYTGRSYAADVESFGQQAI